MARRAILASTVLALGWFGLLAAQDQGAPPSKPAISQIQKLALTAFAKYRGWEKPTDPVRIAGPLYFVGTKGLGVFLFTSPDGLLLMNTGVASSGPMIVESIRKLGFKPEDLKLMINSHAHSDHAGAFAYLKDQFGAELAVMAEEVPAMESGDRNDFHYGDQIAYPEVTVDRPLHDGDTIRWGDVLLTAYLTPGHTRGATTWTAQLQVDGQPYLVVFPDGAGVNPGYQLVGNTKYPGIENDYRRTLHKLEMLRPDIWLAPHNDFYDLPGKRRRAETEGVKAWIDPDGYRRFIAAKKRAFDEEFDDQMERFRQSNPP